VDQVWSGANRVSEENNPTAAPSSQPRAEQPRFEEGGGLGATERNGQPLPSHPAATAVQPSVQSEPAASSPAIGKAVEEKTRSEPAPNRITAERLAKEAALLEFMQASESLGVPVAQADSGRAEHEAASAPGWQIGVVFSVLAQGVIALHQPRLWKRTADESDQGKEVCRLLPGRKR
jgi:hypothetical protein